MFNIFLLIATLVLPFSSNGNNKSQYFFGGLKAKNSIQEKDNTRWFQHGPYLINGGDYYYFSNSSNNHDPMYPQYNPSGGGGVSANYAVNESSFVVSATDSSNQTIELTPQYDSSHIVTQDSGDGTVYVSISYSPHIPDDCQISIDSDYLNSCYSYFHLINSNINPVIDTGIVLYRQSTDAYFLGWDGYAYLSYTNNIQFVFYSGYVVQLAIIYEISNPNGLIWPFYNVAYYHNVGLYCFSVS